MITKGNLKKLLSILEYTQISPHRFKKEFTDFNCSIEVDFTSEKIIYPQDRGLKINDDTTSNFAHPENFVVFECINQLLKKGYRPEHIELEKKWHLGHDTKSGKADICVYDIDNSMLMIIECKTYGKEYKDALKILRTDGGQLFSYWQQERGTKWISLYTSDIVGGEITRENDIINCLDDANLVLLSKKDDSLKLYSKAHTVSELFEVWTETYMLKLWQGLIFGDDSLAYKIGVKPLRKKDLKDFAPDDKIVNKFEEILRHNNVSDKENAFNRLVALFICKLADEIRKGDNDEVEFQYKQGTDTYESLQDRLQRLHQEGMEDFMGEKIFYVPADYPEWLFTTYTGAQRKKAIEDLKEKIKILKFYSNNDFSFKDVHNEELFLQNGKILVEIVQLFEKYRIVYLSKHQFLGDLFEQLLNKGFKQNEGQFFTPIPITRFIWDSLPLREYVNNGGSLRHPKIIDYACGAGHFLTEAVEAVNSVIKSDNNDWVRDYIYGIEKDYRLARVAKISMFMNGAGESNIIFGDDLENSPEKKIINGSFDILVANPPYSVSAFKSHLKLKNNSLTLLDRISNDGGDIETLFVERIAQLLKPQGLAAVILPVSILTNGSGSYVGARETIFKNFHLHSIVLFGSKTFGATGTNTAILFLEKYNEPPKPGDLVEDSVEAILNRANIKNWLDDKILEAYLLCLGLSKEEYHSLLDGSVLKDREKSKYASMYIAAFESSTELISRKKAKSFQKQTDEEKQHEIFNRFVGFVKNLEREKLFYFALTYDKQTVIITSPDDNTEQKTFLGYEWSNRKGSEGIKITNAGGLLYTPERWANNTISAAIRNTFYNIAWEGTELNSKYVKYVNTSDLLDFSREKFDKAIKTAVEKQIAIISKYAIIKLRDVAIIQKGQSITSAQCKKGNIKVVAGGIDFACYHDTANRDANVITISASGANAGFVNYWNEPIFASDCTTIIGTNGFSTEFIFNYLKGIQSQIFYLQKGAAQPHVYPKDIETIPIPNVPPDIQRYVIEECKKVDAEYNNSRITIESHQRKIAEVFDALQITNTSNWTRIKFSNNQLFTILIGKRVLSNEMNSNYDIPVYSANVKEPFGKINKLLIDDFTKGSILWGIDGDWMVNYIPANTPFYPTDHCGVLRVDETKMNPHFVMFMLNMAGKQAAFNRSNRASIDRVKSLTIPNIPLDVQNMAMTEVEEYETTINEAKARMNLCIEQKKAILDKYLR